MVTKEVSIKIVNSMIPGVGVLVLGQLAVYYGVNALFLCKSSSLLLILDKTTRV